MKTKYWSACIAIVQGKVVLTYVGLPSTSKRGAIRDAKALHSSQSAVMKAGADELATNEIVWAGKGACL